MVTSLWEFTADEFSKKYPVYIVQKEPLVAHCHASNIPSTYWEKTFDDFTNDDEAKKDVLKYLNNIDKMKDMGYGLLLLGDNGRGKTMLSALVLKDIISKSCKWETVSSKMANFLTLTNYLDLIKKTYGEHDDDRRDALLKDIATLQECKYLVIDNVGTEHGDKSFILAQLDNLLRYRSSRKHVTFVTTNYNPQEMIDHLGKSIVSLINGCTLTINVTGQDFREVQKNKDIKRIMEEK